MGDSCIPKGATLEEYESSNQEHNTNTGTIGMYSTSNTSFWLFPYTIYFQSKAPLEEIVRALAQLNDGNSSGIRHDMAVTASKDVCHFHYSIQRHSNKQGWNTTAVSEGHLSQEAANLVTVDGAAHIDTSLYIRLAILLIVFVVGDFLMVQSLSILFLFFLILAPIMIYRCCSDRDLLVENISEAVWQASRNSSEKAKRMSRDESMSEKPSTVERAMKPDSVWHEAVSEYDSAVQG
jgi:hypothetical protein